MLRLVGAWRTASNGPPAADRLLRTLGRSSRCGSFPGEWLCDSQIRLTRGTCSHLAPEMEQEAVERIGRVLWQSSATQ